MSATLDRTKSPAAGPISLSKLPEFSVRSLSNGLKVYLLPFGVPEVVEVQVVFHAGKAIQPRAGIASMTGNMMTEGTENYDSLTLNQTLDNFGSWLGAETDEGFTAMSLATVTRNLPSTLNLLREVTLDPTFPETEFSSLKRRRLQSLRIESERTSWLAGRAFREQYYGLDHPYGMHLGVEEMEAMTLSDLTDFFEQWLNPAYCHLQVCGNFDLEMVMEELEKHFGKLSLPASPTKGPDYQIPEADPKSGLHVVRKEGLQSTLVLGHKGLARRHADFNGMRIVNTILGGYFGSRLMKNIREKEGYTYGIYSRWKGHQAAGDFSVRADIGNEYVDDALKKIKAEIQLLIDKGVSREELDQVRNYLLGLHISQRETAFQLGNILRYAVVYGFPFSELDQFQEEIVAIDETRVQDLAAQYLHPGSMLEIVAGDPPA